MSLFSRLFSKSRVLNEFERTQASPYYDEGSLRIILPKNVVLKLPLKAVSMRSKVLKHALGQWSYTPSQYYKFSLGKNVIGHDSKYRYVVEE